VGEKGLNDTSIFRSGTLKLRTLTFATHNIVRQCQRQPLISSPIRVLSLIGFTIIFTANDIAKKLAIDAL
jgi:hypothetical protein